MSSGSKHEETTGKEEEEDLPPLIRIKDDEGEEVRKESSNESVDLEPVSSSSAEGEEEENPSPRTYPPRERWHPGWRSVEQGIMRRHEGTTKRSESGERK
jgi:hypothetical protein